MNEKNFYPKWKNTLAVLCALIAFSTLNKDVLSAPTAGLELIEEKGQLVSKIVLVADPGKKIRSVGLELVYPPDKLRFLGVDRVEGDIVNASVNGCILRIGYVNAKGIERVELSPRFVIEAHQGQRCIPITIKEDSLEGDIRGAIVSPVRGFCPDMPKEVMLWSSSADVANLFMVVPKVSKLKTASILYEGVDIKSTLIGVGSYFYDPLKDMLFFILPGIDLPSGQYPIEAKWDYGQGQMKQAVVVQVGKKL